VGVCYCDGRILFGREERHGWMSGIKRVAKKRAPVAKAKTAVGAKPRARKQTAVVKEIRKRVEERLTHDVEKASLGDYIRLVQLEKELKESEPKEIKVTWVDPPEK
jgi:hypothetical protein